MLRDELNEPLTGPPAPRDRAGARLAAAWGARAAAAALAVALAAAYELRPAPSPVAASIPFEAVATVAPSPPTPAPSPSVAPALPAEAGLAIVRNSASVATGAHQPKIIDVAEALGARLAAAPDKRLVEPSKYGMLPRIGTDGARPSEVYARPFSPLPAMKSAPRIGVFVGGVGLEAESARAATRLPGAVSLGLAPYGAEVARVADSARAEGHEIWLQAPMESVSGPDPGPHTLKAGSSEAENVENLHWLMGRFPGYVGVAGYLGAKFTADAAAFSPVLADIGRRGLDYFDDGASPLSKAGDLAGGFDVRASRADLTLEPGAPAEAAFARAEDIARRQGAAIVVATALPPTLEALARWTATLTAKGFVLTPVSALTGASRERAAQARP
jgi:polysaccharide deacetylase 2 family uncharacterized protein YibQ